MNAPAPDSHASADSVDSATSPQMVVPATEPHSHPHQRPMGMPTAALMALLALLLLGGAVALFDTRQSLQQMQKAQQVATTGQQVLQAQVDQLQQALQAANARATLAQERADQLQTLHHTLQGLQSQSAMWHHQHQAQFVRLQLLSGLAQLHLQADGSALIQTLAAQSQALGSAAPAAVWQPVRQALQADAEQVRRYQQQGRPAWVAQLDRLVQDADTWTTQASARAMADGASPNPTTPVAAASADGATAPVAVLATPQGAGQTALNLDSLQIWLQKGWQTLSSWIQVQRLDEASVQVLTPSQTTLAHTQVQLQLQSVRMDVLAGRDASALAGLARLQQVLGVLPAQDLAASQLRTRVQQLAAQWRHPSIAAPDLQASLQALAALTAPAQLVAPIRSSAAP